MRIVVMRTRAGHRLEGSGPVTGAANRFLEHLGVRGFSPATVRAYAFDLANFAGFLAEKGLGLDQVVPTDLFDYLDWQRRDLGGAKKVVVLARRGPAPSTMNRRVDSVVIAAHDLVDGRSLSSMVSAPAAGAYLKDEIRLGDDGATAFSLAAARLEAGEALCSIVAAWGRASEGDPDAIARALFDPLVEGPFGLTELSGIRAQQWLARHARGGVEADRVAAAERRAARAEPNAAAAGDAALLGAGEAEPAAHSRLPVHPPYPLRPDELPRWADVAVAMIISDRESPIRIAGIGHGSEPYSPGDRDLAALPGLALAVQRALPPGLAAHDIDIAELDGLTLFDEAIAAEAAGLAAPGEGLRALAGDGRINRSGGSAAGYCAPAMGLTRIAQAALRLREPRWALATGSSTVAAQTHTAVVLEARR